MLLSGKPASVLEKGEELDLQREAVALTSGYAAATLGRSVSDALGLDTLGIDLSGLLVVSLNIALRIGPSRGTGAAMNFPN